MESNFNKQIKRMPSQGGELCDDSIFRVLEFGNSGEIKAPADKRNNE